MSIQEIIQRLKDRLIEYSNSEVYSLNNSPKDIVNVIQIAINLVELADRGSIDITEHDNRWFQGVYQVSRNFDDPKWEDIGVLYTDLVNYANKKYFS